MLELGHDAVIICPYVPSDDVIAQFLGPLHINRNNIQFEIQMNPKNLHCIWVR